MKVRTLYWSHLGAYEKCPQMYLWGYGWGDIDVGGGPGKRKPKPADRSTHHMVMGIVIQAVLEDFYNQELYKQQGGLMDRLVRMTKEKLTSTLAKPKFKVNWREITFEEMEAICVDGVKGYIPTMKAHKFLGEYAKSEVELFGYLDKYLPLGGRADFIIRREDTGITMLDGKNSKTKMKYTDPDQLRWYALCHALSYGKMPDRLGFVWYRYPYEEGTEETGVDWIEFTRRDLKALAVRAQKVRKGQDAGKFDPLPVAKNCRFCDYESVCEPRKAQRAVNSAKRRKKAGLPILDGSQGPVEFGFAPIQKPDDSGKNQ
jgi:CRISPR/Cas system-associated exonuclease Cas4 (RecB family)